MGAPQRLFIAHSLSFLFPPGPPTFPSTTRRAPRARARTRKFCGRRGRWPGSAQGPPKNQQGKAFFSWQQRGKFAAAINTAQRPPPSSRGRRRAYYAEHLLAERAGARAIGLRRPAVGTAEDWCVKNGVNFFGPSE